MEGGSGKPSAARKRQNKIFQKGKTSLYFPSGSLPYYGDGYDQSEDTYVVYRGL